MISAWHPVALSGAIDPGTSAGTHIDGEEYVVWRDNAGTPHVWQDRCPHRGMKLSFGFVRGDHIACLYHGWQYDTGGQCRYIPAHPDLDVPKPITVPVFKAAEAGGIIWASTDPEADAGALDTLPKATTQVGTFYVAGGRDAAVAALEAALGPDAALGKGDGATLRLKVDGTGILIAVQPLSAERTAFHVVAEDGTLSVEAREKLYRLGVALRRGETRQAA